MATRSNDAGTPESILEQLRTPFPASAVKQRPGGGGKKLDYVAIETVLERLLEIAPNFSWHGRLESFQDNTAVVSGVLEIDGKHAFGIGAMKNPDADMAVKSANSEAMKNAAKNGFGVALELWDEGHRKSLEIARRALTGSEQALKQIVFDLAKERLGKAKPAVAEVAKVFGVKQGDLSDVESLKKILEGEGII